MKKFLDKEYEVLEKPLTRAEGIRKKDDAGYIEGVISISLSSLVNNDYENFLDLITDELAGSVCLSDIQYEIVGCESSDKILLLVSGHADESSDVLTDSTKDINIDLPVKFNFKTMQNPLAGKTIYQAEKANAHNDYHVTWDLGTDEGDKINNTGTCGEYYTETEVKFFVNEKQWIIL